MVGRLEEKPVFEEQRPILYTRTVSLREGSPWNGGNDQQANQQIPG